METRAVVDITVSKRKAYKDRKLTVSFRIFEYGWSIEESVTSYFTCDYRMTSDVHATEEATATILQTCVRSVNGLFVPTT